MMKRASLGLALLLSTAALPAAAADLVLYDALDFAGHVAEAFTKATGVTVDVVEPGSTGETLGKIAAEGNNPQFDILWVDGSAVFERLMQDGSVQAIPADIAAAAKFNDLGKALMPASMAFIPTGASTPKLAHSRLPHITEDILSTNQHG